jgi:hypothetical protein
MTSSKICNKCALPKPISDFHLNKLGKDGLHCQCKSCKNKYKQEYNKNNKDKRIIYRNSRKHVGLWRSVLKMSIWRLNGTKKGKTIDLLGYSSMDFKNYLESLFTEEMTWDNHGEWHVDHIKDVSSFEENTPSNIVNALSNLRPLWATTREINGIIYEGNLNRNKIRRKL